MPLFIDPNAPDRAAKLTNPIGLVDKYLRDRSAEAYKGRVANWQREQLDAANQAMQTARSAKEAELQARADNLAAAKMEELDRKTRVGQAARDLERMRAKQALMAGGKNDAEAEELLNQADTAESAADFMLKVGNRLQDSDKTGDQVTALAKYAGSPKLKGHTVVDWQGRKGAVDAKTLAELYKRDVADFDPTFTDEGNREAIKVLRAGAGERAAIEMQLPKGTDAIDATLADLVKREEDRNRLQESKRQMWQGSTIATSADRASQYAYNRETASVLEAEKQKNRMELARLKTDAAKAIANSGNDVRRKIEIFKEMMKDRRVNTLIDAKVAQNIVALADEKLGKAYVDANPTDVVAANENVDKALKLVLDGMDSDYGRPAGGLSFEEETTPGFTILGKEFNAKTKSYLKGNKKDAIKSPKSNKAAASPASASPAKGRGKAGW